MTQACVQVGLSNSFFAHLRLSLGFATQAHTLAEQWCSSAVDSVVVEAAVVVVVVGIVAAVQAVGTLVEVAVGMVEVVGGGAEVVVGMVGVVVVVVVVAVVAAEHWQQVAFAPALAPEAAVVPALDQVGGDVVAVVVLRHEFELGPAPAPAPVLVLVPVPAPVLLSPFALSLVLHVICGVFPWISVAARCGRWNLLSDPMIRSCQCQRGVFHPTNAGATKQNEECYYFQHYFAEISTKCSNEYQQVVKSVEIET